MTEVSSDPDPHFDSKIFINPGDQAAKDRLTQLPVFVPAAELDKAKQEASCGQSGTGRGSQSRTDEGRAVPQRISRHRCTSITHGMSEKAEDSACSRSGAMTSSLICAASFQETPALYELKDGKGSLINFDFNAGLYTVPKQLENGYLAIGKQKVEFHRHGRLGVAMAEQNQIPPATVPEQPEAKAPVRKSMPVVIALVVILGLIGIANVSSLIQRQQEERLRRALCPCVRCRRAPSRYRILRPSSDCRRSRTPRNGNASSSWPPPCSSFRVREGVPGPESTTAAPMTAAQRDAIYGSSPNAPQHTSNVSQAQAEAKQKSTGTGKAEAGRHQQRDRGN